MKLQECREIQQKTGEKQRLATAGSHKHAKARETVASRGCKEGLKTRSPADAETARWPLGSWDQKGGAAKQKLEPPHPQGNTATAEIQEQRGREGHESNRQFPPLPPVFCQASLGKPTSGHW